MRVVIQYRTGQVPEPEAAANEQTLWEWLERLQSGPEHDQTVVLGGGRTIGAGGSTDYHGEVFGISVLQVQSVAAAAEMVSDWPELAYGGHLDVLGELGR